MRGAASLLDELRSVDESHTIEAKEASSIDRSVMETVCAFANEPGLGGGHLLLGVTSIQQHGGTSRRYEVVGVPHPDRAQSDLASQCASLFNRPVRPQIAVEELDGKPVLVVSVPELAAAAKPLFFKSRGLPRGAYRRIGSTDQTCTEDDLIALYQDHHAETYDSTVRRDADLTDIDAEALRIYRQLRSDANPAAEELSWSDPELLQSLGAVAVDNGVLRPTVAGLLLFGTTKALRRCFPLVRVDYVRLPGREWVQNPDRRFDTVEICAPIMTSFRRAIAAVWDDLPSSFSLPEGAMQRTDDTALPFRVLREAIVNAIMHRSYRLHGPILILRYANRIEIRNPGHSLKPEEQLGEPGSKARNPIIANVLHDLHLAETKGSGIRTMRELMVSHDLLPPTFASDRRDEQFVATFLFHHFLGADDLAWLRRVTPERLSDTEARALVFVREVGAIDNAAYRSINHVDTLAASGCLRRLRDLGTLEIRGAGSRTYYVPGPSMQAASGETHKLGVETHKPGVETHKPGVETHKPGVETHKPGTPTHNATADEPVPPEPIRSQIATAGSRPRQGTVKALIRALCSWRPLSARELVAHLGREDARDLTRTYLRPMIDAGELAYTIPEMPNHPNQKYRLPPQDETDPRMNSSHTAGAPRSS